MPQALATDEGDREGSVCLRASMRRVSLEKMYRMIMVIATCQATLTITSARVNNM